MKFLDISLQTVYIILHLFDRSLQREFFFPLPCTNSILSSAFTLYNDLRSLFRVFRLIFRSMARLFYKKNRPMPDFYRLYVGGGYRFEYFSLNATAPSHNYNRQELPLCPHPRRGPLMLFSITIFFLILLMRHFSAHSTLIFAWNQPLFLVSVLMPTYMASKYFPSFLRFCPSQKHDILGAVV